MESELEPSKRWSTVSNVRDPKSGLHPTSDEILASTIKPAERLQPGEESLDPRDMMDTLDASQPALEERGKASAQGATGLGVIQDGDRTAIGPAHVPHNDLVEQTTTKSQATTIILPSVVCEELEAQPSQVLEEIPSNSEPDNLPDDVKIDKLSVAQLEEEQVHGQVDTWPQKTPKEKREFIRDTGITKTRLVAKTAEKVQERSAANEASSEGESPIRRSSRGNNQEHTLDKPKTSNKSKNLNTSSVLSDNSASPRIVGSGTYATSVSNPRLLTAVEDAIKRLILPELNAAKEEKSKSLNRYKFEDRTTDSVTPSGSREGPHRVSKSSSPQIEISDDPVAILPSEISTGKKSRRSTRGLEGIREVSRKSSREKRRREKGLAAAALAGAGLTAAALRHHDAVSSLEFDKELEREKTKRRKRSGPRSLPRAIDAEESVDETSLEQSSTYVDFGTDNSILSPGKNTNVGERQPANILESFMGTPDRHDVIGLKAIRRPHSFTPDLTEESAMMSNSFPEVGHAANGGMGAEPAPIPVSSTFPQQISQPGIIPPSEVMWRWQERKSQEAAAQSGSIPVSSSLPQQTPRPGVIPPSEILRRRQERKSREAAAERQRFEDAQSSLSPKFMANYNSLNLQHSTSQSDHADRGQLGERVLPAMEHGHGRKMPALFSSNPGRHPSYNRPPSPRPVSIRSPSTTGITANGLEASIPTTNQRQIGDDHGQIRRWDWDCYDDPRGHKESYFRKLADSLNNEERRARLQQPERQARQSLKVQQGDVRPQTRRESWGYNSTGDEDRSPLQKLEVTLDSISKEEKRARLELAEHQAQQRLAVKRAQRSTSNSSPQQWIDSPAVYPAGWWDTEYPDEFKDSGASGVAKKVMDFFKRRRLPTE
jgi:hypothetical protein